MVANKAN